MQRLLIPSFAVACGLSAGNLYYAQPLLRAIGDSFSVGTEVSGLVVTLTQLGYAAGLLLIVPLGDLLENRNLITRVLWATVLALILAACAPSFPLFAAAALLIGMTSVVAQILVPLAAHLAPPEQRGQVVGQVMSGLLMGILLARAVAGLISDWWSWHGVYLFSAALLSLMNLWLLRILPERRPDYPGGYRDLLGSLWRIFRSQPKLRRRAFYQWTMFGSFSVFWTGITFLLSAPPWSFSRAAIGWFAVVGAVGALLAPLVGRFGDQGRGRAMTGLAFGLTAGGFALTLIPHLVALAGGAILLDLGVQMTLILGQQVIYSLDPDQRSRLNTLYIATFFTGGALGSALAGWMYLHWGWSGVVGIGAGLPLLGALYWLSEKD